MTFTVLKKKRTLMMTVFHGLFSCNWAALSHKFILLKWSFNWVSHTNKIKKTKRRRGKTTWAFGENS